jgi:hypothetical protein
MRPSHIYQPVLIKTLVDCGETATIPQLAQALLLQDESQILYYERRTQRKAAGVPHFRCHAQGAKLNLMLTGEVREALQELRGFRQKDIAARRRQRVKGNGVGREVETSG